MREPSADALCVCGHRYLEHRVTLYRPKIMGRCIGRVNSRILDGHEVYENCGCFHFRTRGMVMRRRLVSVAIMLLVIGVIVARLFLQ